MREMTREEKQKDAKRIATGIGKLRRLLDQGITDTKDLARLVRTNEEEVVEWIGIIKQADENRKRRNALALKS